MTSFDQLLQQALQENQMALSEEAVGRLVTYLELLQTWNQVFNLTSITTPKEMVYLHIIDSLSVQPYLLGNRFLDVGSGGGLPSIPLAICNPTQEWVSIDKVSKKTRFQKQAIAELGLTNIEAVHERCENFHPAEGFDSIVSRAFGTISMFIETTAHLLKPNGRFIAMKGKYPQEELSAIPLSFEATLIAPIVVKGVDVERHVVCLRANIPKANHF